MSDNDRNQWTKPTSAIQAPGSICRPRPIVMSFPRYPDDVRHHLFLKSVALAWRMLHASMDVKTHRQMLDTVFGYAER
jgi:hypothetical protein